MAIRKSSMVGVPFGTSLNRPANPSIGQTYYNGTLGVQEIYTSSGWLPATGANDFNVTINGTVTTATFTKEYFEGAYTINSALSDSTYDIYVYNTEGTQVGYTKSPSLTATGNFNKIVVIGGSTGDLLSFSYKTTFSSTNTTSEITAGAFITSVTPTALNSIDDTTIVSGGNFASNVSVYFVGSDNIERSAKSVVRSSSSSLIVTRPDDLPTTLGTYKVIVENPGITRPTGSSLHILNNAITAGTTPNWSTNTTLPEIGKNIAYSTTLVATDTEGTDIDYSVISGSLPSGITLNSETGVLSGTYTGTDFNTTNLVIRAIDAGGNTVDRTFRIFSLNPVWVTTSLEGYNSGSSYSQQLSVTDDNTVTYTLNSGSSLPSGLSLSSSGLISGTAPSGSTTYNFTIRATDSSGNYTNQTLSLPNAFVTVSTGGQTITSGGYKYHLFKTVGSSTFTAGGNGGTVEVLVVGGGGAGDNDHGGGGGAGGVLYHSGKSLTAGNYNVQVGGGGSSNSGIPLNGSNSVFDNLTAYGGGRGSTTNSDSGGSGGSGGGGGGANSGTGTRGGGSASQSSMNGATGYGNNGGTGGGTSGEPGGGGGGAGQVGGNSTSDTAGKGGNGLNNWSTWLSAVSSLVTGDTLSVYNSGYIAGGGGGGHTNANTGNTGGLGGGGNGGFNAQPGNNPFSGVENTGGGGGSHGNGGTNGGNGGSGVVIVRYAV